MPHRRSCLAVVEGEWGSFLLSCSYPEVLQCYLEKPSSCERQWRADRKALLGDISWEMQEEKCLKSKCT